MVPYVPTAVLVARTPAMADGFYESLRFGEDVAFEWANTGDTAQCRYEPTVVCSHAARPSVRSMLKQRFMYGRSAADIDRRHPWSVAPVRGNILHVLPLALLLCGQLFLAADAVLLSVAHTHFALRRKGLSGRNKVAVSRLSIAVASRHLSTAITREWWPLFVAFSWLMPVSVAFCPEQSSATAKRTLASVVPSNGDSSLYASEISATDSNDVPWKVAAAITRMAALMKSADMSATAESIDAKRMASRLLSTVSRYLRVCTIEEWKIGRAHV